jgi:outer membrane lipoprotein-sorting protein
VRAEALRRWWSIGAAALLSLGAAFNAGAAAFDLEQLAQLLARTRSGEATFVERREVSVLDRTVMTSGRLSFEAPDTFVRENLKPLQERVAVVGNMMTMSRGGRTRSVALDTLPEASVIIEAIRGTLTGNREALEKLFDATVSGAPERWSLELVPRELRLRAQVASIRVSGRQSQVREVVVAMPDGDRSTMTIEPMAAASAAATSGASGTSSAAASGAAR